MSCAMALRSFLVSCIAFKLDLRGKNLCGSCSQVDTRGCHVGLSGLSFGLTVFRPSQAANGLTSCRGSRRSNHHWSSRLCSLFVSQLHEVFGFDDWPQLVSRLMSSPQTLRATNLLLMILYHLQLRHSAEQPEHACSP